MNMDGVKKAAALTLLLIPSLFQMAWQWTNNGLPIADGGDHYRIAWLTYLASNEGWRSAVHFLFHTGGKPILFSAFVAPFIPLAKISILLPVRLAMVLIAAVTTGAYYWLFRVAIRPLLAALMACVIMTIPYVFWISTEFMPETIWHMWFVLFLGALYRSRGLSNGPLSLLAGLFLSLTILARPAESIILIFPALTVYLCLLCSNSTISWVSLILSAATTLLLWAVCALGNIYQWPHADWAAGAAFVIAAAALIYLSAYVRFRRRDGPLAGMLLIAPAVLCGLWLMFYAKPLIDWAYDNSLGIGAKTNDQVFVGRNLLVIAWDVIKAYGAMPLAVLFLLMSAVLAWGNKKSFSRRHMLFALLLAALAVVPMLCVYSITGTSDMRRIFLGMIFLITASGFLTLLDLNAPLRLVRNCTWILVLLLSLQAVSIGAVTTQNPFLNSVYEYLISKTGPWDYNRPIRQVARDPQIIAEIHSLGITDAKIAVFSLGMFTDKPLFQAESLRYVTLGLDRTLDFHTLWGYTKYEPYQDVIDRLKTNGFEYMLLEDRDDPFRDPYLKKRMSSHTFFIHEVLAMIRKVGVDHLPSLGLVKQFMIEGRTIYVFKITGPYDAAKVTATSHLGIYGPGGLFRLKEPGWHSESNPQYPQELTVDFINPTATVPPPCISGPYPPPCPRPSPYQFRSGLDASDLPQQSRSRVKGLAFIQ